MKPRYWWFWVLVSGFILLISPAAGAAAPNKPVLAAGHYHTLAIQKDGSLWAWGRNDYGQLGLGDTTDRIAPVQVGTGTKWVAVAAGGDHSLGLTIDGRLWAWGNNEAGQLGLGNANEKWCPTLVGTGYVAVAAGAYHSLGLKADGSLWAWGWNNYGQLGLGDTTNRLSPTQIKSFNAPRVVVIPLY